jgi:hypothetical protein
MTQTTKTQLKTYRLDNGAGPGVLGIAAAVVVCNYNNRSRLRLHHLSSFLLSSNISLMTSKCGARSITTVGIKINADRIHIANDNARKNGVDMQCYLSGFYMLGQRGDKRHD